MPYHARWYTVVCTLMALLTWGLLGTFLLECVRDGRLPEQPAVPVVIAVIAVSSTVLGRRCARGWRENESSDSLRDWERQKAAWERRVARRLKRRLGR